MVIALLACAFMDADDRAAISDADGDGVLSRAVGGGDCDDTDPEVGAGSMVYVDADGDGFGTGPGQGACEIAPGTTTTPGDCDDADATAHPGAPPDCTGATDRDCDGALDTCGPGALGPILLGDTAWDELGTAIVAVDGDGDGMDEVFAGRPGGANVVRFEGADLAAAEAGEIVQPRDDAAALWDPDGTSGIGRALAIADLDADGRLDWIGGSPGRDGGGHEGAVEIGAPAERGLAEASLLVGEAEGDLLGAALATADIEADGMPEVLVGAPGAAGGCGAAYLFKDTLQFGDAYTAYTSAGGLKLYGACVGGETGLGAAVGFVDAWGEDGIPDLVIAVPGQDMAEDDIGAVFLLDGYWWRTTDDLDMPLDDHHPDMALLLYGSLAGDRAGSAVAAADLDGDGKDEVVIGAPGGDDGGRDAGAVFGLHDLVGDEPIDNEFRGWRILGVAEGGGAGEGLAVLPGDEGEPDDLVIGAPTDGGGVAWIVRGGAGIATGAKFELPDVGTPLRADRPEAEIGRVMAAGDVDGDGLPDLLLGIPSWEAEIEGESGRPGAIAVALGSLLP